MATSRKKRSLKWILLILVPLLGGAAFFTLKAIGRSSPKIDPEKLVKAERIDLARSVVATGKIEPVTKVEIKSKASGIIQNLPVNVGDVVHKGQVICELDENDLLPQVRQSQAALSVAEANLQERQGRLRTLQSGCRRPRRAVPEARYGSRPRPVQEKLIAQNVVDDVGKELRDGGEPAEVGDREPGRRAGRHRQGRGRHRAGRARPWRSPRRICATPPSSRPSTAWSCRATAKSATPSAPF